MRTLMALTLIAGLATTGCGKRGPVGGASVAAFTGHLTQNGKPVAVPAAGADRVQLTLFHEKGQSFGVPIKPDGSFAVGRVPTGHYSANLTHTAAGRGPYVVPGGVTLAGGRTEYEVELGRGWRP